MGEIKIWPNIPFCQDIFHKLILLVKNSHVLLLFDWIYGGQLGLDDHLEVQILILFSDIIHILNKKLI